MAGVPLQVCTRGGVSQTFHRVGGHTAQSIPVNTRSIFCPIPSTMLRRLRLCVTESMVCNTAMTAPTQQCPSSWSLVKASTSAHFNNAFDQCCVSDILNWLCRAWLAPVSCCRMVRCGQAYTLAFQLTPQSRHDHQCCPSSPNAVGLLSYLME